MSGFKIFAVAGAGGIGKFVIEELLKLQKSGKVESVSILSRSTTGNADLISRGAKHAAVDYNDVASLAAAVAGVDVVISTINGFGNALNSQNNLADAAKTAGVKLFVPSEFGAPDDMDGWLRDPHFAPKDALRKKLKALDLPYALFANGFFSDQFFDPGFKAVSQIDIPGGKATVHGVGDALISWTTRRDIGAFVAHVLTTLPKEKLDWRSFRIQGDAASLNEIIKTYQSETGKTLDVTYKPRSAIEERYEKNANDFVAFLFLQMDLGKGIVGTPDRLDNKEFPDWNPKKVIDVLKQFQA